MEPMADSGVPLRPRSPRRGGSHAGLGGPNAPEPASSPAGTAPGDLAQSLLDSMAAIRRTARRVARRPALLSGLTGSQLELVRAVRRRPGISVADAAQELRLAPNTVSTLVGQLTDAGIVVRTPDRDDRRVARLALDPAAARTVAGWFDRRAEAVASVLAQLSPGDLRRLSSAQPVLSAVAELLERDAAAEEDAKDRRHGRGRYPRRAGAGALANRP